MNGQMKKYKDSLNGMSDPIMPSQIKEKIDLKGLMTYAKDKGVKVSQLTEKERKSFILAK